MSSLGHPTDPERVLRKNNFFIKQSFEGPNAYAYLGIVVQVRTVVDASGAVQSKQYYNTHNLYKGTQQMGGPSDARSSQRALPCCEELSDQ